MLRDAVRGAAVFGDTIPASLIALTEAKSSCHCGRMAARKFALFCKSFRRDLRRAVRLLRSVEEHAAPEVGMLFSVPQADLPLFEPELAGTRAELVSDEHIMGRQIGQSWQGQQSVKLRVHRLGFAGVLMIVDSDHYFIRAFGSGDFVRPDGSVALPVTVFPHIFDDFENNIHAYLANAEDGGAIEPTAVPRNGARPGPIPRRQGLVDRLRRPSHEAKLVRIPAYFGLSGPPRYYMHGPIWTEESLVAFEQDVLQANGLTYESLLRHSPWEAQWIGEWEMYRNLAGRYAIPIPFLHFRTDAAILRARSCLDREVIAARYVGVALAGGQQDLEFL